MSASTTLKTEGYAAPTGWVSALGTLSNPSHHTETIALNQHAPEALLPMLESMLRIRLVEECVAEMIEAGEIGCPAHLAIGQEAVAVGVAAYLRKSDRAFGAHRSHSHYLAMGGDTRALLAEMRGRATGCSGGFGGSMHIQAKEHGFYGSVPIVAGTVPLALGAAMAAKFDGKGDVGVAYFGDGACEEGVVHECFNMAASMQLPMVFVVENNLFSSHLDIHMRQPSDVISRFAKAHCMEYATVDGNDMVAVLDAAEKLIGLARQNKPVLLEGITYRWRGHVGPREDVDVGLRRSPDELLAWKKRDPIARLQAALLPSGIVTPQAVETLISGMKAELAEIRASIEGDSWPDAALLEGVVYDAA